MQKSSQENSNEFKNKVVDFINNKDIEGLAKFISSVLGIELTKYDINLPDLKNELEKDHLYKNWLQNYFMNLRYEKNPDEKEIKKMQDDLKAKLGELNSASNVDDVIKLAKEARNLSYKIYVAEVEVLSKKGNVTKDEMSKILSNLRINYDNIFSCLGTRLNEISKKFKINQFELRKIKSLANKKKTAKKEINQEVSRVLNGNFGSNTEISQEKFKLKKFLLKNIGMSIRDQKNMENKTIKEIDDLANKKNQEKPNEFQEVIYDFLVNGGDAEEFAKGVSNYTYMKLDGNDINGISKELTKIMKELKNKKSIERLRPKDMPKYNDIKDLFEKSYLSNHEGVENDNNLVSIRQNQFDLEVQNKELDKLITSGKVDLVIGKAKHIADLNHTILTTEVKVINERADKPKFAKHESLLKLSKAYSYLLEKLEDLKNKLEKDPKANKNEIKKIKVLINQIREAKEKIDEYAGITVTKKKVCEKISTVQKNGHKINKYKNKYVDEKVYDINRGNVGKYEVSANVFKVGNEKPLKESQKPRKESLKKPLKKVENAKTQELRNNDERKLQLPGFDDI